MASSTLNSDPAASAKTSTAASVAPGEHKNHYPTQETIEANRRFAAEEAQQAVDGLNRLAREKAARKNPK